MTGRIIESFPQTAELPVRAIRLGLRARIFSGGTPDKSNLHFWEQGELPWIGSGEVNQGIITAPTAYITEAAVQQSATKLFPKGSVAIALAGQGRTKATVAMMGIDAYGNQSLACIAEFAGNYRFLYWWLSSLYREIRSLASHDTRDGLNQSMVGQIPVPDYPRETQKVISDFLDRETNRIDQLVERKRQFLDMADERWRATLNYVIFPNSPDWEGLPSEWRKIRLKYLIDPRRPIMYGIVLPGPNMEEGPMIVKGGDVKPRRLHPNHLCRTTYEIEAGYIRSRLRSGDLVISIRGGIGDIEIVPPEIDGANLTQDAARIAPKKGINGEWLRYALLSSAVFHPLEARSLGAAVRGINIFDLKRVFVPEPPEYLQSEIAKWLRQQEARLFELSGKIELHTDRLREFRAALITAAVTGQIDVTSWRKKGQTDRRLERIAEAVGA